MKLATFTHAEETRLGVVRGEEIVDLKAVAPDLPTEMCDLLAAASPSHSDYYQRRPYLTTLTTFDQFIPTNQKRFSNNH